MAEDTYIVGEIKSRIGTSSVPRVHEVEKGAIRKFVEAVGDPNPLFLDEEYAKKTKYGGIIAPPSFLCTLGARSPVMEISDQLPKNGLNGGSEFHYYKPVRPGDVITAVSTYTNATERQGSRGRMLFLTTETTMTNQKGELVAKSVATQIRF